MRISTKQLNKKRAVAKVCPHCGQVLPPPKPVLPAGDEPELSPRQKKVLAFVANGMTCTDIANELGISKRTAEFHRMMLMKTLRLKSTAALTLYARDHGYI